MTLGQEHGESAGGVLRACALTLVVATEAGGDAAELGEALARLMRDHPCRAIVIRVGESGEPAPSARCSAQCWLPFGKREQICSEQIEITAGDDTLGDLPPVLLPLAAPDLPVFLWCRSARLFGLPGLRAVAATAGKVIVDSAGFPRTGAILAELAGMRGRPRPADLTWTRLTRLRRSIAQCFENRECRLTLPGITRCRVRFAGASAPGEAYYLAAWLRNCLRSAGSQAEVGIKGERGNGRGIVAGIDLAAGAREWSVAAESGAEPPDEVALLREELSISGADPVFESALPLAARLVDAA